ncbi:orotate phosphoribosyltransferase [Phenylobacterium sp.]|uniref:orotate phosphoribosyltransferase n=1 Tax=Phenylobacterium sp. TaxID=1871053 RepID=UPI0035B1F25D
MDEAARRRLARDIASVARLEGRFTLRSGAVAAEYFDKYRFESDPALLKRVAAAMLPLVPDRAEVLAGLELGGVPIATAMSLADGRPAAFVRKEAKAYGTCQAVEGAQVGGKRVAIIEDVITTGGAVRDAIGHLEAAGAEVVAVVCAIWRGDGEPKIAGVEAAVLPALRREDLEQA